MQRTPERQADISQITPNSGKSYSDFTVRRTALIPQRLDGLMFPLGHRHPEWTQLRDVRNSDTGWLVASVLAVVEREAECPKLGDKQTWRGGGWGVRV